MGRYGGRSWIIADRNLPVPHLTAQYYLVADIGGTNTRIALGDSNGNLHGTRSLANEQLADPIAALADAMTGGDVPRPEAAVIAVAGRVEARAVRLSNYNWSLSEAELERALGLRRVLLVNDFVASAHAVPALTGSDVVPLNGKLAPPDGNILLCGPGTGFGAAGILRDGGTVRVAESEAGHMALGAVTAAELAAFAKIAGGDRGLIIEDVLAGSGLVALHEALANARMSSGDLVAAAIRGETAAKHTMDMFMAVFGRVAGDLALAFNARGGVYMSGGLGQALAPFYNEAPFRTAFEQHRPYEEFLRSIALFAVAHPCPGLVGALQIAKAEFGEV
jgi:glucokinase